MVIFDCVGVRAPNPHIFQGSTIIGFIDQLLNTRHYTENLEALYTHYTCTHMCIHVHTYIHVHFIHKRKQKMTQKKHDNWQSKEHDKTGEEATKNTERVP